MMKSYNSKIIPVLRGKVDSLYVKDIENIAIGKFPNNDSVKETIKLFKETGNIEVRDKVITWFLKYVVSIARNYQEQGLSLSDLISEGVIGLIAAIDQYNVNGPTKFVTYSNTCISRQMREALDQTNRPVHVPKNVRNSQNKAVSKLHKEALLGKELQDILEGVEEKEKVFFDNPKLFHKKRIRRQLNSEQEGENVMENSILLSEEIDDPLDPADLSIDLQRVLKMLTDQELMVLEDYYGLNGKQALGNIHISDKYGITSDRVNKLLEAGLEKLKTEKSMQILAKYL